MPRLRHPREGDDNRELWRNNFSMPLLVELGGVRRHHALTCETERICRPLTRMSYDRLACDSKGDNRSQLATCGWRIISLKGIFGMRRDP